MKRKMVAWIMTTVMGVSLLAGWRQLWRNDFDGNGTGVHRRGAGYLRDCGQLRDGRSSRDGNGSVGLWRCDCKWRLQFLCNCKKYELRFLAGGNSGSGR